jgi:hypothetical protein
MDAAMRLFFHLVDREEVVRDLEGIEVADLMDARTEALRAIEELRHEDEIAARNWSGWTLNVTDAAGTLILSIDLDSNRMRSN